MTYKTFLFRTVIFLFGLNCEYKQILKNQLFPQISKLDDLKNIYNIAIENIPYYRKNLPRIDFKNFNNIEYLSNLNFILKKENLINNQNLFINNDFINYKKIEYKRKILRDVLNLFRKKILILFGTSGSSGSPLHFFRSKIGAVKIILSFIEMAKFHGWNEGQPIIMIFGSGVYTSLKLFNLLGWFFTHLGFPIFIFKNIDNKSSIKLVKKINKNKNSILWVFPSYISEFAHIIEKNGMKIINKPAFIMTSGEMLFTHQRKILEKTFECPIYDFYGSSEVGLMAVECNRHNGLHILEKRFFIENDKLNNIIVTTLKSEDLVLIRYETGDIGEITLENCACGIFGKKIKSIDGRVEEFILDNDDSKIFASRLRQIVLSIDSEYDYSVRQICFQQNKINKNVVFYIQLKKDCNAENVLSALEKKLRSETGLIFNGKLVKEFSKKPGKFKYIEKF